MCQSEAGIEGSAQGIRIKIAQIVNYIIQHGCGNIKEK
jgi:hypothetical protein